MHNNSKQDLRNSMFIKTVQEFNLQHITTVVQMIDYNQLVWYSDDKSSVLARISGQKGTIAQKNT